MGIRSLLTALSQAGANSTMRVAQALGMVRASTRHQPINRQAQSGQGHGAHYSPRDMVVMAQMEALQAGPLGGGCPDCGMGELVLTHGRTYPSGVRVTTRECPDCGATIRTRSRAKRG